MTEPETLYQYCPKVALFYDDTVLLARRVGEADLNGLYSLVGGKIEHSDPLVTDGIFRELTEEIGHSVAGELLATFCVPVEYTKKDGSRMILPHYYAHYLGGNITLNPAEYTDYLWCPVVDLPGRTDVIPNVHEICHQLLRLVRIATPADFLRFGPATE